MSRLANISLVLLLLVTAAFMPGAAGPAGASADAGPALAHAPVPLHYAPGTSSHRAPLTAHLRRSDLAVAPLGSSVASLAGFAAPRLTSDVALRSDRLLL